MINKIKLLYVEYLPKVLEPKILYVSKEFRVAGHLCPCGCGNKIITPLGHLEWKLSENKGEATLYPSIGNWQLPCQSHYWIRKGKIKWSHSWSNERIENGRKAEEESRKQFYERLEVKNKNE